MAKHLLVFFSVLFMSRFIMAQDCTDEITFYSQAQVDQFLTDNPGQTELGCAYFYINLSDEDPVNNLDGLQNIITISHLELYINESLPISLLGLSNIQYIQEALFIGVDDFTGLDNLDSIGHLSITIDNSECPDLSAFDNLVSADYIDIGISAPTCSLTNIFPNLVEVDRVSFGTYDYPTTTMDVLAMSGFGSLVSASTILIGDNYYGHNNHIGHLESFNSIDSLTNLIIGVLEYDTFNSFINLVCVQEETVFSTSSSNTLVLPLLQSCPWVEFALQELQDMNISLPALTSANYFYFDGTGIDWGISAASISATQIVHLDNLSATAYVNSPIALNLNFPALNTIGHLGLIGTTYTDLDDLVGLDSIGDATIWNNSYLTDCSIEALCEAVAMQEVNFANNSIGCNNLAEAGASCDEGFISGVVFGDLDCDGMYDNQDILIENPIMIDENSNPMGWSNQNGLYILPLSNIGDYTFGPVNQPGFFSASPTVLNVNNINQSYPENGFALCPNPDDQNVYLDEVVWELRPGFSSFDNIVVGNQSIYDHVVTLSLTIEGIEYLQNFSSEYSFTQSGNVFTFDPILVESFAIAYVKLSFQVLVSATLSEVVSFYAMATLETDDSNLEDNELVETKSIIGSYDPNDITVNLPQIVYEEYLAQDDLWLEYRIRFQNTGTAEAIFIEVLDEIQEDLDLASLQVIANIHDYELSFEDRTVSFFFDQIMLPDSTSDPEGSQGFIKYRIKTNDGLPIDVSIENTAAIYFDYNPPIITNTAVTEFVPLDITEVVSQSISVYPNPASDLLTVSVPARLMGQLIVVSDMTGREVMRLKMGYEKTMLDCGSLSCGLYQLKVADTVVTFIKD